MLNYNLNLSSNVIDILSEVSTTENTLQYRVRYSSGIDSFNKPYTIKYSTVQLTGYGDEYTIRNTYEYDDKLIRYIVKYSSGREVTDYSTAYRIRYVSENPVEYKTAYRVLYSSEVRLQDGTQPYKIIYTSWGMSEFKSEYTIRYNSVGVGVVDHRTRWNLKYTSQSLGDFTKTYKIKYTASVFYDNAIRYLIRYNTQGSEKILTRSALVKRDDGKFDAIFQIRGTLDFQMDSYFYVLSNMPKYQHVEYTIGDELPYVSYVKYYEVEDIFNNLDNGRYEVKGYLVLKDIDPSNSVSVDAYDIVEYKRSNRAKSFFFGLEPSDWQHVSIQFQDMVISQINYASDKYEYSYLNFVSTEITPVFNPGDTCCFSRKILPPGSPNISSGCSPF